MLVCSFGKEPKLCLLAALVRIGVRKLCCSRCCKTVAMGSGVLGGQLRWAIALGCWGGVYDWQSGAIVVRYLVWFFCTGKVGVGGYQDLGAL